MIQAIQLNGANTVLEDEAVQNLADSLQGEVIRPTDAGYDLARRVWNGMIDRNPALVVRCADVADVVKAVGFARAHNLLTAVRGGGHNVAGHGTQDNALVIALSGMRQVEVDADRRLVYAQGGATIGDVDAATQAHGLAVPLGTVSETGIAGLTLIGGMGWLRNKYGLTADNLLAAEVVTADGQVVTASETENPDLLWGLRGGGGNFGIVTRFTYRAHPIGPGVYFLVILYPREDGKRLLQAYRDFCATAPDEISAIAELGIVPEGSEAFPEELHGRPFVAFVGMYAGPADEGERAMAALRELGEPLLDLSGVTTYLGAQQIFDADHPSYETRYYSKSLNLLELTDAGIERILEHAERQPSQQSTVDLWHLGGAVKRVPNDATAFFGRQAAFLLSPEAAWVDAADDQANIRWARDMIADMDEFSDGSRYLNFQGFQEEGDAMIKAAFGEGYARLVALKQKYDPNNFFRLNQNIKPTA
jgi:FAD/FMN-containing dehydrogenase